MSDQFLPVQQQRIVGHGDHIADLGAVVHRDDPVLFDKRGTGITFIFRAGIQGVGQVLPMNQVVADGVPPVLARVFRRIGLIKKMPAALPEAQTVGIVEHVFRVDVVINGPIGVVGRRLASLRHAQYQGVILKLPALLVQRGGEPERRNRRDGERFFCHFLDCHVPAFRRSGVPAHTASRSGRSWSASQLLYIGSYFFWILSRSRCILSSAALGVISPVIASPVYLVNARVIGFDDGGAGIGPVSGYLSNVS